jgi:hypothetical protein
MITLSPFGAATIFQIIREAIALRDSLMSRLRADQSKGDGFFCRKP